MKTKHLIRYFLLFFSVLSFSCKKESLEEQYKFFCFIDGELLIPRSKEPNFLGPGQISASYNESIKILDINIFSNTDDSDESLHLTASSKENQIIEFYYFNNKLVSCDFFEMIENDNLSINFEFISPDNHEIRLRFQGDLSNSCGDTIEIRRGYFNGSVK
jgi:hypothetical protein